MAIPYLEREDKLEEMAEKYKAEGFLIYGRRLPSFKTKDGEYHFHLGTSVLRTRQILAGNEDRLMQAASKGKDPAASLTVPLAMRMIPRRFPGS